MRNPFEAEQRVLGACLLAEDAILSVMDMLTPAMFHNPDNRAIFAGMLALVQDSKPVDLSLLAQMIPAQREAIIEIYKNAANAHNVEHYAGYVKNFWQQRELSRIGREIVGFADEEGDGVSRAMSLLMSLSAGERGGFVASNERMNEVVRYIEERHSADGAMIGHPTGLVDLDDMLSGLRDGCVYIVAGRPAMGKTAFALNTVLPTARKNQPVLIYSMEMPSRELDLRLISNIGNIPQSMVQHAKFGENEWPKFTAASSELARLPIFIDDTPAQTLAAITAKAKREALKRGHIGVIVVDYIGLMRGDGENRTNEIGAISRGLKALAKDLSCPVLVLAQLNRKCEDRADKRPMLSDLRDSGDIEQDADVVLMLYRDSVYNPGSVLAKNCVAEILVRKNRHGETGEIRVIDNLSHSRFLSADPWVKEISNVTPIGKKSGGYE